MGAAMREVRGSRSEGRRAVEGLLAGVAAATLLVGCARAPKPQAPQPGGLATRATATMPELLPRPAELELTRGEPFAIGAATAVHVASLDPAVSRSARELTEWIRRATGLRLSAPASAAAV